MTARDLVVVDEAGQALEPEVVCAVDAAQARRLILCGDPKQLPPILSSDDAVNGLLAVSPMERLLRIHHAERNGDMALRFLDVQRRMHPEIALYPNVTYYGAAVSDAPSVVRRRPPAWLARAFDGPLRALGPRTVVDVDDGVMTQDGTSFVNRAEADVVSSRRGARSRGPLRSRAFERLETPRSDLSSLEEGS